MRTLRGLPAAATVAAGLGLGAAGAALLLCAARRPEGWAFLGLLGLACLAAGPALVTLPRRLECEVTADGVALGWALGRRCIPWEAVRRLVIGPLGSGNDRDPAAVTLLLADGEEVLWCVLGRLRPGDHPVAAPLLRAAAERGIPVDDTMAPPAERKEREKKWRDARVKGWR